MICKQDGTLRVGDKFRISEPETRWLHLLWLKMTPWRFRLRLRTVRVVEVLTPTTVRVEYAED